MDLQPQCYLTPRDAERIRHRNRLRMLYPEMTDQHLDSIDWMFDAMWTAGENAGIDRMTNAVSKMREAS